MSENSEINTFFDNCRQNPKKSVSLYVEPKKGGTSWISQKKQTEDGSFYIS